MGEMELSSSEAEVRLGLFGKYARGANVWEALLDGSARLRNNWNGGSFEA